MSTIRSVSRRRFLAQSATAGALSCVSGVSAETSAAYQGGDTAESSEFGNSLSVLTTVISRATAGRAIVDAGGKALSTDEAAPEPLDVTGATYGVAGDEYGALRLQDPSRELKVGDQVRILPGHCDTTVNLHNVYFAVRKGTVEHVWPIEGRGRTD